jgi:hypothetical protein
MRRALAAAIVLLASVRPAPAHQVDEYLQATRIATDVDRIGLEITLTPGLAVADIVLKSIDRNGDRGVAADEIAAYGREVLEELVLDVDGQVLPLALTRAESAGWPELRDGVGAIRLEASATVRLARGHHRLMLVNNHRPDIGVYLVNALSPATAGISLGKPQRDVRQRRLVLDFDRGMTYASAAWILVPLAGLAALMRQRGARRHQ